MGLGHIAVICSTTTTTTTTTTTLTSTTTTTTTTTAERATCNPGSIDVITRGDRMLMGYEVASSTAARVPLNDFTKKLDDIGRNSIARLADGQIMGAGYSYRIEVRSQPDMGLGHIAVICSTTTTTTTTTTTL